MLPSAFVTHHMEGRIRLRIPSQRRNSAYFGTLQEKLSQCEGVDALRVNPLTAGLLILHHGDLETIGRFAEQNELFLLRPEDPSRLPVSVQISARFSSVDERLSRVSGGKLDLAAAAFFGLTLAGLFQLLRRNIWPAGLTLLWYAVSVLPKNARPLPPDHDLGPDSI